jgi:hypothetical protein
MNRRGVEFTVTQVEPGCGNGNSKSTKQLRPARRTRTSGAWQPTEFNSGLTANLIKPSKFASKAIRGHFKSD